MPAAITKVLASLEMEELFPPVDGDGSDAPSATRKEPEGRLRMRGCGTRVASSVIVSML